MDPREIAELCEAVPPNEREQVADFARFLIFCQGDEQWETLIGGSKLRPKPDAFLKRSSTETGEELLTSRL
ncbi:hypothetical protein [Luteolibacter sp. Populi]|uniref:hypothetical protein n=1 Tax=Luteolibacter sp. Populi TaxID=3230487 RepID=UPI003467739C